MNLYAKAADAFAAAQEQAPETQAAELKASLQEAETLLRQKQSQGERRVITPPPETLPSAEERREFTASLGRQGPAIHSMEDYMRYRNAGGSTHKKDESSFLAKAPDNYVPTKSREEFLSSLGINNAEARAGSSTPDMSMSMSMSGGSTGAASGGSNASRLAQARAEQAAMLAGTGGGASDWSKIRGTDTSTAAASPSPAAQMGHDWSKIRGTDTPKQETPLQQRVRAADLPAAASGASSRSDFIAAMGLDMRGSDVIDYGSQRPASSERSPPSSYNNSPDKMGTMGSTSSYEPTLGASSRHSSRPSTPGSVTAAKRAAHANREVFGGMFDKTTENVDDDVPDSVKRLIRDVPSPAPSVDYKALGANVGAGVSYKHQLLSSFRGKKAVDTTLQTQVGDERLEQVKTEYADFSYRKFREDPSASRLDQVTKSTVVGDAILAEAMSGYDYREIAKV
eukprot:NODE_1002_length_1513_cov_55.041126_g991_i0.p1 GENE.NODE_1002_length_1513_cov_55.041126_g991_i0~~NODE_1002_length_1513_cov_55.041126_g991_i0.p1  ORF type:complete len:496 (+),score=109.66 NODE_1002_length_1513_cov_55.041126_g991_i0:129-1490(+)